MITRRASSTAVRLHDSSIKATSLMTRLQSFSRCCTMPYYLIQRLRESLTLLSLGQGRTPNQDGDGVRSQALDIRSRKPGLRHQTLLNWKMLDLGLRWICRRGGMIKSDASKGDMTTVRQCNILGNVDKGSIQTFQSGSSPHVGPRKVASKKGSLRRSRSLIMSFKAPDPEAQKWEDFFSCANLIMLKLPHNIHGTSTTGEMSLIVDMNSGRRWEQSPQTLVRIKVRLPGRQVRATEREKRLEEEWSQQKRFPDQTTRPPDEARERSIDHLVEGTREERRCFWMIDVLELRFLQEDNHRGRLA